MHSALQVCRTVHGWPREGSGAVQTTAPGVASQRRHPNRSPRGKRCAGPRSDSSCWVCCRSPSSRRSADGRRSRLRTCPTMSWRASRSTSHSWFASTAYDRLGASVPGSRRSPGTSRPPSRPARVGRPAGTGPRSRSLSRGGGPLAPGAPVPAPLADAERGRRLFVAKGCVTCHLHRAVNETSIAVGPELTGRRFAPEYLARFLADPAAVIPPPSGAFGMPNLRLKPAEIAALTAFLNTVGQEASR